MIKWILFLISIKEKQLSIQGIKQNKQSSNQAIKMTSENILKTRCDIVYLDQEATTSYCKFSSSEYNRNGKQIILDLYDKYRAALESKEWIPFNEDGKEKLVKITRIYIHQQV